MCCSRLHYTTCWDNIHITIIPYGPIMNYYINLFPEDVKITALSCRTGIGWQDNLATTLVLSMGIWYNKWINMTKCLHTTIGLNHLYQNVTMDCLHGPEKKRALHCLFLLSSLLHFMAIHPYCCCKGSPH